MSHAGKAVLHWRGLFGPARDGKLGWQFVPSKFPGGPLMLDRLLAEPDGENGISAFSGLHPRDAGKLLEIDGVARNLHGSPIAWRNHQNTNMTRNGAL